jgi:hypothetical protein
MQSGRFARKSVRRCIGSRPVDQLPPLGDLTAAAAILIFVDIVAGDDQVLVHALLPDAVPGDKVDPALGAGAFELDLHLADEMPTGVDIGEKILGKSFVRGGVTRKQSSVHVSVVVKGAALPLGHQAILTGHRRVDVAPGREVAEFRFQVKGIFQHSRFNPHV